MQLTTALPNGLIWPIAKYYNASTLQMTNTAIWTPASGKKIMLAGIRGAVATASEIRLLHGTTQFFSQSLGSNTLIVIEFSPAVLGIFEVDEPLQFNHQSAGAAVAQWFAYGYEV